MGRIRILSVIGTRPEAIKMAPVVQECRRRAQEVETVVCLSGQHREMLRQVTEYFEIAADVSLDVMTPGQSLAGLSARLLEGIDRTLDEIQPACVVAQGDTTTVLAASLAAFYRQVPFVHVEAGLRTGNFAAPWPEELNRRVASLSAALHCAPTPRARERLLVEGVPEATVHVTGNTVIDALLWTVARERPRAAEWEKRYGWLNGQPLVLVTGHRRESFGAGMREITAAIADLAGRFPEAQFVYPVHLNPSVQGPVRAALSGKANVHLLGPVPYPEFVWLMDRSTLILTDSGGVQEEAPSLKKPVVVMRDSTERPEAVEAGAAELVGTSRARIAAAVTRLLTDPAEYARRQLPPNPYGDGRAAARIVDLILAQDWPRT